MSVSISISDAKANFSAAIRRAESGEAVFITRHGKRVAGLVDVDDLERLERLRTAGPEGGLASVAGSWEDADELADLLDEHERTGPREGSPLED